MNKRQFLALLKLGLIQSNPQITQRLRAKGKYGPALIKSLVLQNTLFPLLLVVVYGGIFLSQDLYRYPGQFNGLFLVLIGISLSQGITLIYNTFFDNNDFDHYKTLPLSIDMVIFSKSFITIFTIIVYLLPCFIAFLNYGLNAGTNIVLTLLLSLLFWLFLIILLFSLALLLLFGLSLVPAFKQKLKQIAKTMMVITSLLILLAIMLNTYQTASLSAKPYFFIQPFLNVLKQPFSKLSLLSLGIILAVIVILVLLTRIKIYPLLTQNDLNQATKQTKKALTNSTNAKHIFIRYQMRLIGESSLLFQIFSMTFIMPIVLSFSMVNLIALFNNLDRYFGLFLLLGVLITSLVVTPNSLPAILVSLERQNFPFLFTTPLSKKMYLNLKLTFILAVQLVANALLLLFICFIAKLNLLSALCFLIGGLWFTIPSCMHYLFKDYRFPFFEWSDYLQLVTRGQSNGKLFFMMLLKWIVAIVLVVVITLASSIFGTFWPNLLASIAVVVFLSGYSLAKIQQWRTIR